MLTLRQERRTYRFFEISVFLKGLDAVLEIIGAVFVFLISPQWVATVAAYFTAEELGQDPNDFIANHLLHYAQAYAAGGSQDFAAAYLFSHGLVKVFIVAGLLRGARWSYPVALAVFGLFVAYQAYLVIFNGSIGMAALTVFDLIVLWFVWREWRIVRAHTPEEITPRPDTAG